MSKVSARDASAAELKEMFVLFTNGQNKKILNPAAAAGAAAVAEVVCRKL